MKPLVVLLLCCVLVGGVSAQDGGRGVVRTNYRDGAWDCDPYCDDFTQLTLPTLYARDPATGLPTAAGAGNFGLVLNPGAGPVLHLRDDLTWGDGMPVTAYDVLYKYVIDATTSYADADGLHVFNDLIAGARLIDEYTLELDFLDQTCAAPARVNQALPLAHVRAPDFRAFVDAVGTPDELLTLPEWIAAYRDYFADRVPRSTLTLPLPGTPFQLVEAESDEGLRLVSGDLAVVYSPAPVGIPPVERFLTGQTNLLLDVPFDRRADVRAARDVQIAEMPGGSWDMLLFTLADPTRPRDAFDEDGERRDQGQHPLFGDLRVRQAVQLAINVDEVIESTFHGNATPMAANYPPTSWAFDPDLAPLGYDPTEAERLLDEAGWVDVDGDGVRNCYHCLYGTEGMDFYFMIGLDPQLSQASSYAAAESVSRQLRRVGIAAQVSEAPSASLQEFDAYWFAFGAETVLNRDPDQAALWSTVADVVDSAGNPGSYSNPHVDALLEQARMLPGCDVEQRAALYREVSALLQADQPAVWLYARHEFYAARGIESFAPYPDNPLWNVTTWRVHP